MNCNEIQRYHVTTVFRGGIDFRGTPCRSEQVLQNHKQDQHAGSSPPKLDNDRTISWDKPSIFVLLLFCIAISEDTASVYLDTAKFAMVMGEHLNHSSGMYRSGNLLVRC